MPYASQTRVSKSLWKECHELHSGGSQGSHRVSRQDEDDAVSEALGQTTSTFFGVEEPLEGGELSLKQRKVCERHLESFGCQSRGLRCARWCRSAQELSSEGRSLNQALMEAQQALEAARQADKP